MIWRAADVLFSRHVRLVFATGYAVCPIEKSYNRCQVAKKPVLARAVIHLLSTESPAAQLSSPDAAR